MHTLCLLLALLSIWDYPARQQAHVNLRSILVQANKTGQTNDLEKICRKGVEIFPEEPTWHYNLACAIAHDPTRSEEALDTLEESIDLGFRNVDDIAKDHDWKALSSTSRFKDLLEYARSTKDKPLLTGPLAGVEATGATGQRITIGAQNLCWDFDTGCFIALMKLSEASAGGNTGDLYMNRDNGHAPLPLNEFPGLTEVRLDSDGHQHRMDIAIPNMLFPYPLFGNCSMAFVEGAYWRSIPRSIMTLEAAHLPAMQRFYLSNQTWVFPSNADTPPVGTNGDVFASITPYWITTAGRSFSDLPYLKALLTASKSLQSDVKKELVSRGLLAPMLQVLLRKTLHSVTNEADYLTPKAHPTAFPPNGFDLMRLARAAASLQVFEIPPLVTINLAMVNPKGPQPAVPEVTYATPFAWAFILRSEQTVRDFAIQAKGAEKFAFVQTHGDPSAVKLEIDPVHPDIAKLTLTRTALNPTNRVDIMVCGRNKGTGWGAPAYVSFAVLDGPAPYSDPALNMKPAPKPAERQ